MRFYNARTGNVWWIRSETDKNGVAVRRPLPLGRYKIVESRAADFYGLDKTPIEVEIEFEGPDRKGSHDQQGPLHQCKHPRRPAMWRSCPANRSATISAASATTPPPALPRFIGGTLCPAQAVRLDKIVTGTYNVPGNYKVVYKTNLSGGHLAHLGGQPEHPAELCTGRISRAALGLASNEYVTRIHGVLRRGAQPTSGRWRRPQVYCHRATPGLTGGSQFVNQADVGGVYNGQWIMATSRWVTKVYKPSEPLPRTGY